MTCPSSLLQGIPLIWGPLHCSISTQGVPLQRRRTSEAGPGPDLDLDQPPNIGCCLKVDTPHPPSQPSILRERTSEPDSTHPILGDPHPAAWPTRPWTRSASVLDQIPLICGAPHPNQSHSFLPTSAFTSPFTSDVCDYEGDFTTLLQKNSISVHSSRDHPPRNTPFHLFSPFPVFTPVFQFSPIFQYPGEKLISWKPQKSPFLTFPQKTPFSPTRAKTQKSPFSPKNPKWPKMAKMPKSPKMAFFPKCPKMPKMALFQETPKIALF